MINPTKRPYIEHGVGRFTAPPNGVMNYENTLEFIEQYSINSELYQDIKVVLDKAFATYAASMRRVFRFNDYFFCAKLRINDVHKVMTIEIIAHRRPRGEGTYFQYNHVEDVFVSLSEDGLITDILPKRPKMNPAIERVVWNKKP